MKEPFIIEEKDLHDMAQKIIDTLTDSRHERAKVLFLEGDLGAGKTTFTKEVAAALGIAKDEVHSPTFILKKEYNTEHPFFEKLIHIDAYRFDSPEEVKVLRLDQDIKNGKALIVVEWPSKLGGIFDEDMTITFSVIDDATREVVVNYVNS